MSEHHCINCGPDEPINLPTPESASTVELETWQEMIDTACDQRQAAEQRLADLIGGLRKELAESRTAWGAWVDDLGDNINAILDDAEQEQSE